MKSDSAAQTFFAIPELVRALFAYLTQHDLTRCIRVCKQWLCQAEPVLWSNFSPGEYYCSTPPPETIIGLDRHKHYMRVVELFLYDRAVLQALAHDVPPNVPSDPAAVATAHRIDLRRLKMSFGSKDRSWLWWALQNPTHPLLRNIVTLLNHNIRLTHLTLRFPEVAVGDPLLAAIANLKQLQYLAVDNSVMHTIGSRTISMLLQACLPLPKLRELYLCVRVFKDDLEEDRTGLETIIKSAAIARFSQTAKPGKIKALELPSWAEVNGNPLALPLLKSDLLDLESCTVFSFAKDSQPRYIEKMVRKYCPNVKHLKCRFGINIVNTCKVACAFVRGCSGLRSFASPNFCEIRGNDANSSSEQLHIISELVLYHCDTLEDIELECFRWLSSVGQQAVLSRCKQLKRYHIRAHRVFGNVGFNVMDVSRGDWACTGLRQLRMTPTGGYLRFQHAVKWFYGQIGRLEKLEQLALDVRQGELTTAEVTDYGCDLTLSKGWLGELAGLKSLRCLSLDAEFCIEMGQAEVEFMHQHWPLLCEINIAGSKGLIMRSERHWRWLFNKRPQLLFKAEMRAVR
ncbi:hypothetical protein BGZ72_010288 [Mortierella alpina]|nr:hypothetical protein BGZ72_010288 [Mortierella alpina]